MAKPAKLAYQNEGILLPPVIPQIKDWPIAKLLRKNKDFVKLVQAETLTQLHKHAAREGKDLHELIATTMHREHLRMVEDPWKIDPKDERKFWKEIKHQLVQNEQLENDPAAFSAKSEEMLESIVSVYANEISSTFKPSTYHFAKRVLPFIFSTLLNASAGKTIKSVINHRIGLQEKVHLRGEIDALRTLAAKGTIVLVPTHISNVDSIIVGWSLHALGLPAFIYGAGLNLFNNKILAHFMSRAGAYRVDRRKRNPIYRTTLDAYSTLAIEKNCHSLFFPGGTRSRTGMIEKHLKLGLLGTAVEAQRRNFLDNGSQKKIFVVPVVMSYHFVLEAKSLINQHLKRTGQEQYYIINDEFASYRKFIQFIWKTFGKTSDITLNFGKPMDIFGNFVDEAGVSIGQHGRDIDVKEYFMTRGEVREDVQRDGEYTRMLGERIVDRYHAENHVFSSHIVAFVAFEMLKRRFPDFDLYALLRLSEEDRVLGLKEYLATVDRIMQVLKNLRDRSKVMLSPHLETNTMSIIEHGVKNLGLYHSKRPLTFQNPQTLASEDMNLLYYYRNRLEGYGLENHI